MDSPMSSSVLHISATFLQPTCHARMGREDAAPNEWPPSPLRLFQAIVAGAAARWVGESGSAIETALTSSAPVAALRWLEALCESSLPTILAPSFAVGHAVPRYVPNNSADLVAAQWARGSALATFDDRTRKVIRPTHLLDGMTVHYMWPLDIEREREARAHESALAAASRCMVALGWGIDSAIGDARVIDATAAASLAGERWEPVRLGAPGLRTPLAGTLDALIARHSAFLDRMRGDVFRAVPPLRAFGSADYRRVGDFPHRPFAAFVLRPLDGDGSYAAFSAERSVCVAAMLRHLACRAAQNDLDSNGWRSGEWALRFVAGHGPEGAPKRRALNDTHPRFSYLVLPTIGHPHADGMIRRVLIAEPWGGDGRSARWAAQRLAGAVLEDQDRGPVARLESVEPDEVEFARVFRLYAARAPCEASTVWASTTPVILPGFDDNKVAKRERLLVSCLRHSGLDPGAIVSIESRPTGWLQSTTAPLSAFKRPAYFRHLPAVHVRLQFSTPVTGPIALGAGRHCGLGVLAAQTDF